jgi:outer membrane biosynthesis protein TonB
VPFAASALDAVCDWRFKPATLDGRPVKVYYTLTVNFEIGGR